MTFLPAFVVLCAALAAAGEWCVSLLNDELPIIGEDARVRRLALDTARTADSIEGENRDLVAIEAACVVAAVTAPENLGAMRDAARAVAGAQDLEWKTLLVGVRGASPGDGVDFARTSRSKAGICSPGAFEWGAREILGLRSRRAGIVVARDASSGIHWSFRHPGVTRELR